MKLTKQQQKQVKEAWGDWERVHTLYDLFMEERLKEIDPEFLKSLKKTFKGATCFWVATCYWGFY